ncbi:MAG: alpha/beta fold hydrolase [Pseudomonadota bacterium]
MQELESSGAATDLRDAVIEALYELPLGGDWLELQKALCSYWMAVESQPDEHEISLLERHFDRALSILEKTPADDRRWLNDLYRLPVAACAIDQAGEIIEANDAGWHILSDGEASKETVEANRISLRSCIRELQELELAATTVTSLTGQEIRIYVRKMPQAVSVAPLFVGVLVAKNLPEVGFQLLAHQFQLTPAESRLCLQMASGASLDDIAQTSEVKKTTLRTHLAHAFEKLGVKSQAELVALVLHHMFAGAVLNPVPSPPVALTPYLDPEIHGFPKFSKFQLADGRTLGFFEYGDPDGVPTIYCHGSFETGMFAKSQRLNGNGVRMIAVERSGVGESTPNPDPSPEAYAKDIMQLVDYLGWREYAVIGRSMGSWDAISLTLADQQRVRLLLFASCKLPVQAPEQHKEHLPAFQSLYNAIWNSKTMGRIMLRAMQVQLMFRGPEQFLPSVEIPPIERALVEDPNFHRVLRANWFRSGCFGITPIHDHLSLYRDPVPDPPWIGLRTPTVLVHGARDKNVPLERILKQTETFRKRKVVILDELGHMTIHTSMGQVLRILNETWQEEIHPEGLTNATARLKKPGQKVVTDH